MRWLDALLQRRRLVIATTVLLSLAGLLAWSTMPREEDPQFPHRDGIIITAFPGADALTVERLVVEPIEEHLAEVDGIGMVDSTSRAGVSIVHVDIQETVYDTDSVWDDVQDALAQAAREFPAGVSEPDLQDDMVSQDAVVYALVGSSDPLVLLDAAERVKRHLLSVENVKQINLFADPGEQITIEYDDATARRLGVDAQALGDQLSRRSKIVPGGVVHLGEKSANLRPQTEFRSLAELRKTPITLPSGTTVALDQLARVRQGPAEPPTDIMRWNGEPAVAVGVVPRDGIDRVRFGSALRERVAELKSELEPLRMDEVVFQPDLVKTRLDQLTASLRLGILIVALILFVAMGPRLGAVVAMVVPLVAFSSIALFAAGGGILHQISIAALVIALGMLVDNAIVVAENIQFRIDEGLPIHVAAVTSVKELALPLGTATGTTLAAFVPMLVSKGNTADFTRTIPVMIMLSLAVSYVFAVLVTPVLSQLLLRPSTGDFRNSFSHRLAGGIGRVAVRRWGLVLVGAVILLGFTAFASRWVGVKFFPAADRQSVIVDLEMPEGTHLEATDAMANQLERELLAREDVRSVAAFVGRNGPKVYYNLLSRPQSPHRSRLLVETTSMDDNQHVISWVRDYARRHMPEASVVAKYLEQGPPIGAPVELRVMGHDLADIETVADHLLGELRTIDGTRDVRHDLGLGVPTVRFEIDDAAAARYGFGRSDVARALAGRTLGTEVGQFRAGDDPVPILIRSSQGEDLPATALATIDVMSASGEPVPLSQVATLKAEWLPAAIYHMDRTRMVKVQAQLAGKRSAIDVMTELEERLAGYELPAGMRLEFGGELEESGKANAAILQKMPFGLLLLLFFLLLEFNSFRRVAIIMMTVPLAAVGVVPGLILSGNAFGFMSMLGVISLVGIVVNNAIVLLDVIENKRNDGASIDEALEEAVKRRTRPILLTMATTVAGLSPLAFSSATLWPPLAWAMISGLIASTVLTLLVIPALYKLLFDFGSLRKSWSGADPQITDLEPAVVTSLVLAGHSGIANITKRVVPVVLAATLLALGSQTAPAQAVDEAFGSGEVRTVTLQEAMQLAAERPAVAAALGRARAAELQAVAVKRSSLWPVLGVSADVQHRDRGFSFGTPLGDLTLGDRTSTSLGIQMTQPIFDPAVRRYQVPAARERASSARADAQRLSEKLRAMAAEAWLSVLEIDAAANATDAFVGSLDARLDEMQARVDAGRVLEAEALKIRLDLESAQLDRTSLEDQRRVAAANLGRLLGLDGPAEPTPIEPASSGLVAADLAFDGAAIDGAAIDGASLLAAALEKRADLAAALFQLRSLELQAKAVRAERLPRLAAQGTWSMSDGDPFRPEELGQVSLGVTWSPFAAGTRAPRAAADEALADALRADIAELRRGVAIEVEGALAELSTARAAVIVRERGVELATETLRVEGERNTAGRSTTNDLLDAEAALRRQRTLRDVARLDVMRAQVRLNLAVGDE